ncbi:beta-lactamase family protein [Yinghuangia sp. ASG 101]|uniref:serine hydrolase domain-containing protein n=1 Tax=Yinghuangia sp. ASG 101 TaxID=2896848 RepID=UPI001E57F3F7|nr:serine hydrolase domain-containing protein [Yinghuangia sp. ASG 101]UGQ11462.1 beta-lactamase family protein [Yinghuangia sp. ASG 101]
MTTGTQGDERLVARLGELLGPRHPVAAAAIVTPEGTRVACRGADLDADFEIGSIAKAVTGLLYADALTRGEIDADTSLGDLLPLGDVPAAHVTLRSLTTHRSGLPRLPKSARPWRRTIALWRHGTNPYGEDLEQLLDQARGVPLDKPEPRYSNLGFELLGHALAHAAATTYPDLVRQRIASPLGLDCFYVPATPDELRPGALSGRSRRGRPRQPWTGEALGPAGGIRASITSMARFTAAVLDGAAPGIAALDPVAPLDAEAHIGAAWITIQAHGRPITLHNGGTGGFRSWLGLDRHNGTGVTLLSATAEPVDPHGFTLLAEHSRDTSR